MALLADLTATELNSLKGRTVIITGGASGIGQAAVRIAHGNFLAFTNIYKRDADLLKAHGANVTIADVTVDSGRALESELKKSVLAVKPKQMTSAS